MNGGKIFIDVDALQKVLAQEVAALFDAYKALPEQEDNRAAIPREGKRLEENPNDLMTGPRNSLIFKIYTLHLESFLFA